MKEIESLVDNLCILQGVGEKTATRYAYEILGMDKDKRNNFIEALESLNNIKKCKRCNGYTLNDICDICNEKRDENTLVVLAYPKDITKIEKVLPKKYYYHILGGVINPLEGIGVENLDIKNLLKRLEDEDVKEIILVLPTNNEGELTASYLKKITSKYNVEFTKLAQGVPIGGDLEYLDELTLLKSIEHRQEF